MTNQLLSEEDQSEPPRSVVGWWRAAKELDKNSRLTAEDLSSHQLTPRLRVLREMERLALVAPEGLDDLRHKLIAYRSGDFWVPTGGMKKEEMEIPGMITIVLVGLSGSGKSSLVNLMYSVLGRSGLIPFTQTSSESSNYTRMYMEEHNVLRSMRSGFCVYDTRGLDCHQMIQGLEEVTTWMVDGVRHYQLCCRPGDDQEQQQQQPITQLSSARFAKRMVNCVMVVANLVEIHKGFENGDLKAIGATRDLFLCPSIRRTNENPILILTHGDMLSCEERINGRLKICEYLGIPETTGAYDIACITEQGFLPEESDVPVTAFALSEAVYRALLRSDRTHLPKKKLKDWVLMAVSWVMCSIAAFFAMLAVLFSKLGCRTKLKL